MNEPSEQPHCREIQALRRDIDDLRAQQDADKLAFAGVLQGLEDQVAQLRRELADERRFRQSLTGRFNSLEYVS